MRQKRVLKKSVFIIGEGPTEKLYYEHLKNIKHFILKVAPAFPKHSDYQTILSTAEKKLNEGFDYAICVFDLDKIISDGLVDDWLSRCRKAPKNIIPVCSNPCIEIWFLQHFIPQYSNRYYECYEQLLPALRKFEPNYDKSERFFTTSGFFERIDANETEAISKAERLMKSITVDNYKYSSFSEVYRTIAFLEECRSCDFKRSCNGCIKSMKDDLLVTRLLRK